MGIAVSLILIAAGAILEWGVTAHASGLNLNAIGAILMVIGVVGFVLSLLLWQTWWGPGYFGRTAYVEGASVRPWARRTTYVEDEAPRPADGPPPPP